MINIELWNKRRKELKLSLFELSKKTEISISTIKDIFRGATTDPRIETVQRIEQALGLDKQKSPPPELAEGEKAWLKLYYELNEDDQATLIKVVQAFKDMSDEQRAFMMQAIRLATKQ